MIGCSETPIFLIIFINGCRKLIGKYNEIAYFIGEEPYKPKWENWRKRDNTC
jgi:hypothetical protein